MLGCTASVTAPSIPHCALDCRQQPKSGDYDTAGAMTCWENEMRSLGYGVIMTSTQVDEEAQHFY